jgi:hypothetical protein
MKIEATSKEIPGVIKVIAKRLKADLSGIEDALVGLEWEQCRVVVHEPVSATEKATLDLTITP